MTNGTNGNSDGNYSVEFDHIEDELWVRVEGDDLSLVDAESVREEVAPTKPGDNSESPN